MSRSRLSPARRPGAVIARLIIFGIIIGVGFALIQRWRDTPVTTVASAPTLAPSPLPTVIPAVTPQATSTAYPRAVLYAPTAGINASIIDVYLDGISWDVSQLGANVGHLQGTGWFGMTSNIGLAGHVELGDGRLGIFHNIDDMKKGDPIFLQLGDLQQDYKVTVVKRVKPDDLSVLSPTTVDTITLITCDLDAYSFIQNVYLDRIVVVAERVQSS